MTSTRIAARGRIAGAFVALLLGAGCGGGLLQSDQPPAETYRIAVAPAKPESGGISAALPLALAVGRPRAATSLDTDRIAVVPASNRFDYYTGVRWAEPAPEMLQHNLVAALSDTGRFAGVYATPARVPAELLLDVELRHFEAGAGRADTAPVAYVAVQASLIDVRRGQRVTSFQAEAHVPAAANRREAIVAAFEKANGEVVRTVAQRVAETAATVQVAPPAPAR